MQIALSVQMDLFFAVDVKDLTTEAPANTLAFAVVSDEEFVGSESLEEKPSSVCESLPESFG